MRPRTPASSPIQEKHEKKRARKRKLRIIRISIISAVVIGFLILLLRLPVLRITNVSAEGNQLVQSDELIEATWSQLLGNHLLIIPNNNIFFLRKNHIHKFLMERFPRIKELEIDRSHFRNLELTVVERPHAFLWCADTAMGQCYFADDQGLLFAKAPYFSGSVFLAFIGGDVAVDNPIDSHIMTDQKEFMRLIKVVHALEDKNFEITRITIGLRNSYTLSVSHINNIRTRDGDIIINTNMNPDVLLHNMSLAMNTEQFKTSFASNPETLDYIDARLDEKVFYKFGIQKKPAVTAPVQQ